MLRPKVRVVRVVTGGVGAGFPPLNDVARLSLPNVFQRENTFSGIRLGDIKVIFDDYTVLPTDCVILADCSILDKDIIVTLPPASGNGQFLRIRKTDPDPPLTDPPTPGHILTVQPQPGDMIDQDLSVAISDYSGGILIEDGKPNFWDKIVPETIVNTTITNEFENVTIFNGVQFVPITVTDDHIIQDTDTFILVDCSVLDKDIDLTLPVSNGSGQWLHIKKIDSTNHVVRINVFPGSGDLIDGAVALNFSTPGTDAILSADASNYWDNWGPSDFVTFPILLDNSWILEDGSIYLYNPDQNKYHPISIGGAAGEEYISIGVGLTEPP